MSKSALSCPSSATHMGVNVCGLLFMVSAVLLIRSYGAVLSNIDVALIVMSSYALPIIFAEFFILKYHRRDSYSLDFSKRFRINWSRVGIKLIGFYLTIALIALFYWLFPEYHGKFYHRFFYVVKQILPVLLLGAIPYFCLVDAYMKKPKDSYWHLGMWITGNTQYLDKTLFKNHFLGWLVKAFFLPLMLTYFFDKIPIYRHQSFAHIFSSPKDFYDIVLGGFYAVDVLLAATGYLLTFRLFDSHIRSAEPTFLGWFVAIECYQPFWGFSSSNYLNYTAQPEWGAFFWNHQVIYTLWALMILGLIFIYVWATVAFGIRFSNLTHRGILSNGPFRFTKHPAYISKNLSWWLISMPFLFSNDIQDGIRRPLSPAIKGLSPHPPEASQEGRR